MNYFKYSLIKESESKELFILQSSILSLETITEVEKTLTLALLLMQNPIRDYETAIAMLNDVSLTEVNLQVLIIGAEIDSVWPIIQPNPFIDRLKAIYPKCLNHEKSIIAYLEAINIDNLLDVQHEKILRVPQLLKESVELCDDYVYNYYRLALLSDRTTAKLLMEKALSNVTLIETDGEETNVLIDPYLSFERYLSEHITGTRIGVEQFSFLKNYYSSL